MGLVSGGLDADPRDFELDLFVEEQLAVMNA